MRLKPLFASMLLLLALAALWPPVYAQETASKSIEGIWQGALSVSGIQLRLVVKIHKQPGGTLTGTMDSIDQGAKDIPIDQVTFKDNTLRLELKGIGGVYEGKLNAAGTEFAGEWQQGGNALPLTLARTEKAIELRRPQEPQKPYPYDEEELTFENKAAGVKLAGTLTRPKTGGPFPAVVLIAGSGPNNRNEDVLGHKVFLVLADYLTRHGIAVLRYDKRGIGASTGSYLKATTADFAADALAAVEYLKGRKEIAADKIGLIGHSEGGVIAPIVASESKDVAFVVLMAGTGIPGEQILYLQGALIAQANGASPKAIAREKALQEQIFTVVKQEKDPAVAEKKIEAAEAKTIAQLSPAEKKDAENQLKQLQAGNKTLLTPWFRYFLTYDPKTALRKVQCPILVLNGSKDLQVPPKENLPAIQGALQEAGNKDVTIKELTGLNHLFQTCKTGSPLEYSKIEETMSPVALQTISDWIQAHTQTGN